MNRSIGIGAVILVTTLAPLCHGQVTIPANDEAKEIQQIKQRLEDKSLPEPPMWTLIHMAADKEKAEAIEAFCSGPPDESKPQVDLAEIIRKGGGLQKYRQRIAGLLRSRDATVRGFAAVWLADFGDPAYVKDILALLQAENLPNSGEEVNTNWDRGQAAFALGILGGREQAKVLGTYLHDKDAHLRAGAAAGLARLKAKEYQQQIAALLQDDDLGVICSATMALAELGAKRYDAQIAALLHHNSVDAPEVAMTALAMLDAKEQAPIVAGLLGDNFKGGQAAKTLALLGAEKYGQDIAALLNSGGSLTRRDALLALGILQAKHFTPEIARCMRDKEGYVRSAAAWAIVMMEAEPYTAEASKILKTNQAEKISPMGSGERGIPQDRLRQLNERFEKCFLRIDGGKKTRRR